MRRCFSLRHIHLLPGLHQMLVQQAFQKSSPLLGSRYGIWASANNGKRKQASSIKTIDYVIPAPDRIRTYPLPDIL